MKWTSRRGPLARVRRRGWRRVAVDFRHWSKGSCVYPGYVLDVRLRPSVVARGLTGWRAPAGVTVIRVFHVYSRGAFKPRRSSPQPGSSPPRAAPAAPAAGGQRRRGRWKRPFEFPSMLPLLSSPLAYFFFPTFSGQCITSPRAVWRLLWRPDLASPMPFHPCGCRYYQYRLQFSHYRDERDNRRLTMGQSESSPPLLDG